MHLWLAVSFLVSTAVGFTQTDVVCSGFYKTSDFSGTANTNAGQPTYDNNMHCLWQVDLPPLARSTILVSGVSESCCDKFIVCNKVFANCRMMSGNSQSTLQTKGSFYLFFYSDSSVKKAGITADWTTSLASPINFLQFERVYVKEDEEEQKRSLHDEKITLYVEVANPSDTRVSDPFSIQWATAESEDWRMVPIEGVTIQPHQTVLVKMRVKGSMAFSGKLVITSPILLTCGHKCAGNLEIADFLGYGVNVEDFAGSGPALPLTKEKGLIRKAYRGDNNGDWERAKIKRWEKVVHEEY